MRILDRLRRALADPPEPPKVSSTESQPSSFFASWRGSGVEGVAQTDVLERQAHVNPTSAPQPAVPYIGLEKPLPEVHPTPALDFAVESQPRPAATVPPIPTLMNQLGSDIGVGPLYTEHNHLDLLAGYQAAHIVKGVQPGGVPASKTGNV